MKDWHCSPFFFDSSMSLRKSETSNRDPSKSLFSPILVFAFLMTFVLFGVVNFFAFWGVNADLKRSITEELENHNRLVSKAVLQFFIGKLHTVLLLEQYEPIQALLRECQNSCDVPEHPNYHTVVSMLRTVDKMHLEIDRIYQVEKNVGPEEITWLASVSGDFLLTQCILMDPDFVDDDGTPNPWITKNRPWYSYISKTRDIAFTDTYIDVQFHIPCVSIVKTIREPSPKNSDKVIGIVGFDIFLSTVDVIMQEAQNNKSGMSLLIDGNEIVIYHPSREFSPNAQLRNLGEGYDTIAREIEKETESKPEVVRSFLTNIEGVPSFVSYTRIAIPNVNWYIVSIVPQSEAERNVSNYFFRIIVAGSVDLLLFLFPIGLFFFLEQRKRKAVLEINKKLISAQETILMSEIKFRTLFNTTPSGLALYDPVVDETGTVIDLCFSEVNPALLEITGLSRKDLIGERISNAFAGIHVISEAFKNLNLFSLGKAALAGDSGVYQTFYPKKQTFQQLLIFETGTGQVASFISDDTERVKNEHVLQTMKSVIDNISEPVVWINPEGNIRYVNNAGSESLGYEPGSPPIGEKIWKFDVNLSPEKWKELIEQIEEKQTVRFRTEAKRKNGILFPVYVTINIVEHNEQRLIAACFRDMSEQIRRIEAEQTARAKSRFLDHMSHEMRTPLNGMLGMTYLLFETELTPTQKKYIESVKISGLQLLSIVEGILDFSELDAGTMNLCQTRFDVMEVIQSVIALTVEKLDEKDQEEKIGLSVKYATPIPRYLIGDKERLKQVILAMLDNAVKFTESGKISLIVVDEKSESHADESLCRLHIEIADTGIGISDKNMQQLFESFTIGDASFSRKYSGVGLGLVVAKKIVELMGGNIFVESKVETDCDIGGSRFWLVVPLPIDNKVLVASQEWTIPRKAIPANRDAIERVRDQIPAGSPRILVVEDNKINQLVISEILRKADYEFDVAGDGGLACEAVASKRFSLILMDCQLPIMDGFEATRKIRSMEMGMDERRPRHSGRIPIVALTANTMQGDEEQCLQAGMDAFCRKPIEPPQLIDLIKQLVNE